MFVFQPFPLSFSLYRVYCDCPWIPSGSDVLRHALFNTFPVPAVGCLGWRLLVETCDTREAPCRRHDFTFAPGHMECHGVKQAVEITGKKRLVLSLQGHPRQQTGDWKDGEGASAKYTI